MAFSLLFRSLRVLYFHCIKAQALKGYLEANVRGKQWKKYYLKVKSILKRKEKTFQYIQGQKINSVKPKYRRALRMWLGGLKNRIPGVGLHWYLFKNHWIQKGELKDLVFMWRGIFMFPIMMCLWRCYFIIRLIFELGGKWTISPPKSQPVWLSLWAGFILAQINFSPPKRRRRPKGFRRFFNECTICGTEWTQIVCTN